MSSLKKTIYLLLFMILTVATTASSLSTTEVTLKSSGLISYSQSPSLARPLHVEGNQIKNDLGQIVYLRGVNRRGADDHPSGFWGGWRVYEQSKVELILNRMQQYRINCIGYFIAAEFWINNPDVTTETGTMKFRDVLHDLITRCENHGMYFLLATYRSYNYHCPIHGSGNCKRDHMAYPPYCSSGHENLIPTAEAFKNYIVDQVDKLGSHVNLLFKFWDEPWGNDGSYQSDIIAAEWHSVWQDIITAVRQKETEKGYVDHLIVLTYGPGLAYWGDMTKKWKNFNYYDNYPFTDPSGNLVYGASCYRFYGSVGGQEPKDTRPTDYTTIKDIYVAEKVYYLSTKAPILIDGIGAHHLTSGEYTWLKNTLRVWNEWGIGYLAWVWWDIGTLFEILEKNTEATTGGTLNKYGQIVVDAIKEGSLQ